MEVTRRATLLGGGAALVALLAGCGRGGDGGHDARVTSTRVTYGDDPSQWVDRYDVPAGP